MIKPDHASGGGQVPPGGEQSVIGQVREFAIFRMDLSGRPITWNAGVKHVLGFDEADFIGRDIMPLIFTPEDISAGVPQTELEAAKSEGTASDDRWMRRRDGRRFFAFGVTSGLFNQNGQIIGFTKIIRDMTGRKVMEESLREIDLRRSAILNVALDCIVEMDHEGRILDFNPASERTFGYRAADVIGRTVAETLIPERLRERHWKAMRRYLETGERTIIGTRAQLPALHADGHEFPVELAVQAVHLEGRDPFFIGFVLDMTERERQRQELITAKEELERRVAARTADLERRNRMLREFAEQLTVVEQRERENLASVLHDGLQQILVACKMQVELSLGRGGPEAARHAKELLDDAIATTRSLSHELNPPAFRTTDFAEAVNWLARWFKTHHDFQVKVMVDDDFPIVGQQIRIFLFKAIRELLLNSIKHSGVKSASVELRKAEEGYIDVIVSDQGQGFDLVLMEQDGEMRHGFGLFGIRERLYALGGCMDVESAPGAGAKFTLILKPEGGSPREQAAA